jgi:RNA polymerase sigma-70 factor (ECF subfamily)
VSNSDPQPNSATDAGARPIRPLYSAEDQARDVALMARVVNGEREALGELYDRHATAVLSLMMPILRDRRIAEETLQDLFLNLWQRPHTYDSQRGAFAGWILRVARNRAIDVLRKQRERRFADFSAGADGSPLDPTTWLVDPEPDPSDQAVSSDLGARVRDALTTLSPEQRETLELAYFGGLSHREIADQLKRPLGTVKTQIRSGMQRLAQMLAGLGPEHVE